MPESRSHSLRHWEAYYRTGALASCPLGSSANYTLELQDAWTDFFRALPDRARILDVGTGNGAVALIARRVADSLGRAFDIHGTDLAQIDPIRDVQDGARLFQGIRFHPMVATEDLPFEPASFDAVSGQYSIEYSDVNLALREIHRVLRPGAGAQFVLHHADSVLVRNARESLVQISAVLQETAILRLLRRHLATGGRSKSAMRRDSADLTAALAALQGAKPAAGSSLILDVAIDAVQKLLAASRQLEPSVVRRQVDQFEGELRAAARRLEDLVRCGQTRLQVDSIADWARVTGFEVCELVPQHHAGVNLVGWRLRLLRPAGSSP